MNRPFLLAAALAASALLGSCKGSDEPEAQQSTPAPDAVPAAAGSAPTSQPATTPASAEPVDVAAADEIPSVIQGTWGMNEADCDASRADAKGNLRIGPNKLEFYESVARLGKVQEREASRIRATYAFEGEGQTWTQDVVLEARDGGQRLVRRDYGQDAMPGPLEYKRCS